MSITLNLGFSSGKPWVLQPILNLNLLGENGGLIKGEGKRMTEVSPCRRISTELIMETHNGMLCVDTGFTNVSDEVIKDAVMQVGLGFDADDENITIPHVLYNDNPSADPERLVAKIGKKPGSGVISEEHRLPIPGINVDYYDANKKRYSLSLLSIPEIGDCEDENFWALGAIKTETGVAIQALSGQTMFNGTKDLIYAGKNTLLPYERGYKFLLPGETIRKRLYIDFTPCGRGHGFRELVKRAFEIYKPNNAPYMPHDDVIKCKQNCLDSRYYKDAESSGYHTFGSANSFGNLSRRPSEYYLYGWTGQALRLAICDYKFGNKERAIATVDFFAKNAESKDVPGMYNGYYQTGPKAWYGAGWKEEAKFHYSSRIHGEAMTGLIDFMVMLKEDGQSVDPAWEESIKRACGFLADERYHSDKGIFPMLWHVDGPRSHNINTAGISCVTGLAKAYGYFKDEKYLELAKEKLQLYYNYQAAEFDLPFSRMTMDARCEDKEAGMYFFQACLAMFEVTGDKMYDEWAAISADWIMTFVYFWDNGFKKDSYYHKMGFTSVGWPGVSVQNHHLDVFFPCFEMYEFGKRTGNKMYEHFGRLVYQAFTHGICTKPGEWKFDVIGEQSEQFYHTNYFQSGYPNILPWCNEWRKDVRIWNPSWIIAQVLEPAWYFKRIDE